VTQVSLRNITKRFGETTAVDDVSLEIASGEFICLLGASGCGKTTLLRILGGFTAPDTGEILADGQRLTLLPPNRRRVGFVFQSYALFPTKTVAENIGFGLAVRRRSKREIAARVSELCELTRLDNLQNRYPHELSGGQQQRVALARALAPEPTMLLLDEPLSALDAKIRAHLRAEIRAVVDRLKITTVHVTHDQEEALSMADRVGVMHAGQLLQVDTPMNIYLKPRRRFVAEFVGTSNSLSARAVDRGRIEVEGATVSTAVPDGSMGSANLLVSVRPEHVIVSRPDASELGAKGVLKNFSFSGAVVRARIATANCGELVADVATHDWLELGLRCGDPVGWCVRNGASVVLPEHDA
jgi:ABC-type Fe3+/spermidine/putrescine transport system ATPase subunit